MEGVLGDIGIPGLVYAIALVFACALAALVARAIDNGAVALPVAAVSGAFFGVLVTLAMLAFM